MAPRVRYSRLELLLADRTAARSRLDERCARLLAELRERCPTAVPPEAPEPGGITDPVVLDAKEFGGLVRAALSGDARGGADTGVVLLTDGDSELLVDPTRCRSVVGNGVVLVVLGVECDQTGPVEVTVPFAVGSAKLTSGMVMAAERLPRGPQVVTIRWGDALVALAWEALVSVTAGLSRHVGTDRDALPLIPGALLAEPGSVTLIPQARYDRERS
ncbi:MAG: hypothetical protein L0H84_14420 [Pseudonocardia sp.]|nr:hypothetical protein [Pseudonocardia sp.]